MIETIVDFENAVRRAVASMEKFSPGFLDFLKQKIGGVAGMDFDKFLTFKAGMGYRDFENMKNIGNATPPIPVVALNIMLGDWMAFRGMSYPHIPILHAGYVSLVPPLPSWEAIYRECCILDDDSLPLPDKLAFMVGTLSEPQSPTHILLNKEEYHRVATALQDENTSRIDFQTDATGDEWKKFYLERMGDKLCVYFRHSKSQGGVRILDGEDLESFLRNWSNAAPAIERWFELVTFIRAVLADIGVKLANS